MVRVGFLGMSLGGCIADVKLDRDEEGVLQLLALQSRPRKRMSQKCWELLPLKMQKAG